MTNWKKTFATSFIHSELINIILKGTIKPDKKMTSS